MRHWETRQGTRLTYPGICQPVQEINAAFLSNTAAETQAGRRRWQKILALVGSVSPLICRRGKPDLYQGTTEGCRRSNPRALLGTREVTTASGAAAASRGHGGSSPGLGGPLRRSGPLLRAAAGLGGPLAAASGKAARAPRSASPTHPGLGPSVKAS